MGKDPAVLWYFDHWFMGTATLTRHQKGCYMDILSVQFNSGPLSLEDIKTVLGADFGQSWSAIQRKFKQTQDGLFYNERLEAEKSKRVAFCDSRRQSRLKAKNTSSDVCDDVRETYVDHTVNVNVDVNKNKNTEGIIKGRKKFIPPTLAEVEAYCKSRNNQVNPKKFISHYEANGWIQGRRKPIVNWQAAIRTWEGNKFEVGNKTPERPMIPLVKSEPMKILSAEDMARGRELAKKALESLPK